MRRRTTPILIADESAQEVDSFRVGDFGDAEPIRGSSSTSGGPVTGGAAGARMKIVPFGSHFLAPLDPTLDRVAAVLDPILAPLGFAAGQAGASGGHGQVIFCRGLVDGTDSGCADLVLDVEARPDWRITDVRYWGHPTERWHLTFDRHGDLTAQLSGLVRTLPDELS